MKTAFVTLLTLAASAFAAPVVPAPVQGTVNNVQNTVADTIDTVKSKLPVRREVEAVDGLIELLESLIVEVRVETGAINETLVSITEGEVTKSEGAILISDVITTIQYKLSEVVTTLTGTVKLDISPEDVTKVVGLVVVLVGELLATVNYLLSVLGAQPIISSLLHSVFSLVSSILNLLVGIVGNLLPALTTALGPLLSGLTGGLLGPLLAPVTGLLGGLPVLGGL